jgi:hypothetical protein
MGKKHKKKNVYLHSSMRDCGPCPVCMEKVDGHTSFADEPGSVPSPGSVSMCCYCASFLVYTEEMRLRKMHPGEIMEWQQEDPVKVQEKFRTQQMKGPQ